MAIEFVYDSDKLKEQTKKNVEDLIRFFSKFDYFDANERKAILQEQYAYRIVSIASYFNEAGQGAKESASLYHFFKGTNGQYDDFDPRYNCFYGNGESSTIEAKINQTLIDLEQRLDIEDSPEARFILLNAVKYLAGRDVDVFELRKAELSRFKLNNTGLVDSLKMCDTFELDYEADMAGMDIKPRFDPRKERFIARMKKTEFEAYVLHKISLKSIESLAGIDVGLLGSSRLAFEYSLDEYIRDNIGRILEKYKPVFKMISDEGVERFERLCLNSTVNNFVINYALKYGKKTKLDLEFEGRGKRGLHRRTSGIFLIEDDRGRDYFLYGLNLNRRHLKINEVGDYCLKGSEKKSVHKIKRIEVNRAGEEFMGFADVTAEEFTAGELGCRALVGSFEHEPTVHNIGIIKIKKAGDDFMIYANLKAKELHANMLGTYALSGSSGLKPESNIQIGIIDIGEAGDYFMANANVNAKEFYAGKLGSNVLSGSHEKFSTHNMGIIIIGKAEDYLMRASHVTAEEFNAKELGDNALRGSGLFQCSNHNIKYVHIGRVGDNFLAFANITGRKLTADKVGRNAFKSTAGKPSDISIEVIKIIEKVGENFMYGSNTENVRSLLIK